MVRALYRARTVRYKHFALGAVHRVFRVFIDWAVVIARPVELHVSIVSHTILSGLEESPAEHCV